MAYVSVILSNLRIVLLSFKIHTRMWRHAEGMHNANENNNSKQAC